MIIGIDASRALRAHKTGVEWYSYELLRSLAEIDTENSYRLYFDRIEGAGFDWPLPANFTLKKPSWPFRQFWTLGGLTGEMLRNPPEVLFVPSHGIPLIHPARTYTTVHDVGFLDWKHSYSLKDWQYLDWSTRRAVRECKQIITISEFTKRELVKRYGAKPDAIKVIYFGYARGRYTVPSSEERESFFTTHQDLSSGYVVSVGRIDERKNQKLLAQAFAQLGSEFPELKLVLIGPKGFRGGEILKEITTLVPQERLRYLDWMGESEKIQYIQHATCLALPSLYEGFGLPVLEAQACGTLLACSNTTALPEVAGKGALYFDPTSVEGCATVLRQAVKGGNVIDTLRHEGLKNVAKFSWEACARETLEVLIS